LLEGTDGAQMKLITPSRTELLKTNYGLPTGRSRPRSHQAGISLGEFERLRAVSLTGYSGDPVIEYADPQGLTIHMSHSASEHPEPPIVLYNIWGDATGGFFSPEPWVGLQNSLVLGKGIVALEAAERFEWKIRIEFEHSE
jgi:hypothetical protein